MGWDTQVGILIEDVTDEKESILALFLSDPPLIYHPFNVFEKSIEPIHQVLYLTYQGRKHPPVAWFDKISAVHTQPLFTLLGSHIDFLGGPAGLIKMKAGQILDSYAYFDRFTDSEDYLHPEFVYQWFGLNGQENIIRQNRLPQVPKCSHDEDLVRWLVELSEIEKSHLSAVKQTCIESTKNYSWRTILPTTF